MKLKAWSCAASLGLMLMTLVAVAGESPAQTEEQSVTVEAKVMAIDYQTREVTLQAEDGSVLAIKAGPAVKRLNEIKKGDGVELTYHESLAMSIVPAAEGAEPSAMAMEAAGRAPDTQNPAGAVGRKVDAVVEITGIDKAAQTVNVKGPEGNIVTVRARHPENLDKIKVGDRVHIVYTQAIAIAIVPKAKH